MNAPSTEAMRQAAATQDSTHGLGPQASAAQLICWLRDAYPHIQTKVLNDAPELAKSKAAAAPERPTPEPLRAQYSLIGYLDCAISIIASNATENENSSNANINGTRTIVQHIIDNTFYSEEDKKRILVQMRSIATTCPGVTWNDTHFRWSTNRIYNAPQNRDEWVTASPAETLNLVCEAILDSRRYSLSTGSTVEKDRLHRIHSLCRCLLSLQEQVDAGQLQKCSTGRQHDLLWLLDRVYLNKPNTEGNAKPIELMHETNTFLLGTLTDFVENEFSKLGDDERSSVTQHWILWQSGLLELSESPVVESLRKRYPSVEANNPDAVWKKMCLQFMSTKCKEAGLNPQHCKLDDIASSLPDVSLPGSLSMMAPLITKLLSAKSILRISAQSTAVKSNMLDSLVVNRKKALVVVQDSIKTGLWMSHTNSIQFFIPLRRCFRGCAVADI
jgi:hypothetical protein